MSKLKMSFIPAALIETLWFDMLPLIKKVVDKAPDEIDIEILKNSLINDTQRIVAILDKDEIIAVNVLAVSTLDTGIRVLHVPITGGSQIDEWMDDFMKLLHETARHFNCTEIRGFACRKGWIRKLKDFNWYEIHTVIGCKVKEV